MLINAWDWLLSKATNGNSGGLATEAAESWG